MDTEYAQLVNSFLASKTIAIAGVSSDGNNPGNYIYKKLKDNGYDVYGINPRNQAIKDIDCYPTLADVPVPLDAVIICTHPSVTESVMEDGAKAGIKYAWIHKSIGEGSFSKAAAEKGKQLGIKVIPIGCPMMFVKPDIFHKCFRFFIRKKLKA
jgi:uncharacterized protein